MGEPAAAEAAQESTETKPVVPLREQLIASAKELTKAREAEAAKKEKDPEKPNAAPEKPKDKAPEKEKAKADGKPEKEEPKDDEAEEFKKQRRDFAKFQRKKDAELSERETKVTGVETRLQHELATYEKDPIAWLRSRGRDIRKDLLRLAQEDAEDPKEKQARELKERQDKLEAKQKELDEERQRREVTETQQKANAEIERALGASYKSTDAGDYPLLSTLSTPEKVAAVGRKVMVEHWVKTASRDAHGNLTGGEELAPDEIFAILEAELRAEDARSRSKATGKKPEPPDRVRSVAKSEPESPETRQSPRSARDVTNRTARVRTADDAPTTGKSGLDREALRAKLITQVREHVRS